MPSIIRDHLVTCQGEIGLASFYELVARLDSLGRALGIDSVPIDSSEAFSQFLNWGFATVAGMLLAAFMAVGYRAVLPQAPVWLNVVMWFVCMAAPVYAVSRALRSLGRYMKLRIGENRGM